MSRLDTDEFSVEVDRFMRGFLYRRLMRHALAPFRERPFIQGLIRYQVGTAGEALVLGDPAGAWLSIRNHPVTETGDVGQVLRFGDWTPDPQGVRSAPSRAQLQLMFSDEAARVVGVRILQCDEHGDPIEDEAGPNSIAPEEMFFRKGRDALLLRRSARSQD